MTLREVNLQKQKHNLSAHFPPGNVKIRCLSLNFAISRVARRKTNIQNIIASKSFIGFINIVSDEIVKIFI